jgi:hypothetical protein
VALIRTDVSEDHIASISRVHECEQVTERSCKLLYRHRLVEDIESSNLSLSSLPKEEYYVRFEVSTTVTMMIINSQKMIIIIVTTVETSNLTIFVYLGSYPFSDVGYLI